MSISGEEDGRRLKFQNFKDEAKRSTSAEEDGND
jgi:hypothetical protein